MGIIIPVLFDWDNPWTIPRLLTGDGTGAGYIGVPVGGWQVGARPPTITMTFDTAQDNLLLSYWITNTLFGVGGGIISQQFTNVSTPIGTGHTVVFNLTFNVGGELDIPDLAGLIFHVTDSVGTPIFNGVVTITNISVGGAAPAACFWKNLNKATQVCS